MSAQCLTVRDNAGRFHTDQMLMKLTEDLNVREHQRERDENNAIIVVIEETRNDGTGEEDGKK